MFFAFVFHQSLTHTKDINQSSLKHYCMGRILDFSCHRQSRNITLSEIDRRPHFIKFHSTVFKKKNVFIDKRKGCLLSNIVWLQFSLFKLSTNILQFPSNQYLMKSISFDERSDRLKNYNSNFIQNKKTANQW